MNFLKKHKDIAIVAAAIVMPGGLIALGLWKAYELTKKKQEVKPQKSLIKELRESMNEEEV